VHKLININKRTMSFVRVGEGAGKSLEEVGTGAKRVGGAIVDAAGHLHPDNHDHFVKSLMAIAFVGVMVALGGWALVPGVVLAEAVAAGIVSSLAMTVVVLAANMRHGK
jgi:hypothetical protein